MRGWLSGRALPCQGKRREFESRLPLQKTCLLRQENMDWLSYVD